MQLELAQKIVNIALEYDFDDADIDVRSYRGRGDRFNTIGIVGLSLTDIIRIVIENPAEFMDVYGNPLFEDVGNLQTDSMGLSQIIY